MNASCLKIEVGGVCLTVDASEAVAAAVEGKGAFNWALLIQVLLEALMKFLAGSGEKPTVPTIPIGPTPKR